MSKERLFPALVKLTLLSIIVVFAVSTVISEKNFIGPVFITLVFYLGYP